MKLSTTLALVFALTGAGFTAGAHAQSKDAYLQDGRGVIVRNSNFGDPRIGNLCWRTGYWTPAMAIRECDPDLIKVSEAPPPPPPRVVPPPQPRPAPVNQKMTFAADTFFDFDKSVLKPDAKRALDDLVGKIANINLEVVIAVGHTDAIGSNAYNDKLSVRRAEAVKAYLVSKGIETNRVYTEGKGKKQPIADNKTAEGRAKNRRVEVEVVGTSKR
ncbi:MAG TPA: OmpA family protein [Burkholderiales bacterium]|jgi:OOP family OmpA-OmpF porin